MLECCETDRLVSLSQVPEQFKNSSRDRWANEPYRGAVLEDFMIP
jgi:hypothetical protein